MISDTENSTNSAGTTTTASDAFTVHWDGDTILFVSDANGVEDFKLGLDGEVSPRDTNYTGFTYYSRDWAGDIIMEQNSTRNSGLLNVNELGLSPTLVSGTSASGSFKAPSLTYFPYIRGDGFNVSCSGIGNSSCSVLTEETLTINGVRAYDSAIGTWTTPDDSAGNLSDPASLQRNAFNRNNAIGYADPSGFSPLRVGVQHFPDYSEGIANLISNGTEVDQFGEDEYTQLVEGENAAIDREFSDYANAQLPPGNYGGTYADSSTFIAASFSYNPLGSGLRVAYNAVSNSFTFIVLPLTKYAQQHGFSASLFFYGVGDSDDIDGNTIEGGITINRRSASGFPITFAVPADVQGGLYTVIYVGGVDGGGVRFYEGFINK